MLIALWENDIPFTYRHLEDPGAAEERVALWPVGRFPILVDDARTIAESSIIIEHLDLNHPGATRWLPEDRGAALEVRFMDRFFDNHVMTPMQKPVAEALRAAAGRKDEAWRKPPWRWTRPTPGWKRGWPGEPGRRATASRFSATSGLSLPPIGEALLRAGRRRGASLSLLLSAGRARPGLSRLP